MPFSPDSAALGDGMSLYVVEREGAKFEIYELKASGDVNDYLATAWGATLERIDALEHADYSPEIVVRADDERVLRIHEDVRGESDVVASLMATADREKVSPDALSGDSLYLYAVVSDTEAGRVLMIKKTNPTRRARQGKRWAAASTELKLLSDDPWQLHPMFDVVFGEDGGFVLSTHYFDQLFADSERLRERVKDWATEIAAHLPLADGHQDELVARCRDSARLRRRLRSIAYRGHISKVKIADVKRHLKEMELEEDQFLKNGKLIVDAANADDLLRLLNEDLMRGGLTQAPFRVESKEPMPP